jgi:Holliday junction resolvase
MATNGRQKGKRGELEVAHLMIDHGFDARRGQQFKGTKDSPDVIHDMGGFAIEVKLRETFSINDLYAALDKQQEEAPTGEDAIVFYRRNRKDWIVVMDANRFLTLMNEEVYDND